MLRSPALKRALKAIDRAHFVPVAEKDYAYADMPLHVSSGQTISQPYTVVFMLELLQVRPGNTVFEIGYGSGWQTMILSSLVGDKGHVVAVEVRKDMAKIGASNIDKYNPSNVELVVGNAITAANSYDKFDRIISGAAFDGIPEVLDQKLKDDGIAIVPTQDGNVVKLTKLKGTLGTETYEGFTFVPIVQ
ncbi:methyltransferase domain-containing protein [Candidatus Dojkabacteria bacterium]|nr:methyltransferase domain-containing protein [Candidatus Dojkabacteria bacterium]